MSRPPLRRRGAASPAPRRESLFNRIRSIGTGPGDLEERLRTAERTILEERPRFTASDAGRMQWNWYLAQLAGELALERSRLADPGRKHGPADAAALAFLDELEPRLPDMQEPRAASPDA